MMLYLLTPQESVALLAADEDWAGYFHVVHAAAVERREDDPEAEAADAS